MSLHLAAKHIAAKGRGPDDSLVHMSKGEIKSLQDLAKANGGSLTINPETGLPEAGFLSSILPMLAGLALGPAGLAVFGSSLTAGLGVGAATGLATGSLKKGLMAGLGAYGGAGLGQGLSAAGAASTTAAPAATAAAPAAGTGAVSSSVGNAAANAITPVTAVPQYSILPGAEITAPPMMTPNPTALSQSAADIGNEYAREQAAQNAIAKQFVPTATAAPGSATPLTAADSFAQMGKGVGNLGTKSGFDAFLGKAATGTAEATGMGGGAGLFKSTAAAALPAIADANKPAKPPEDKPNPYEYSYDYQTGQYGREAPGYRDSLGMNPGVPMQMAGGGFAAFNQMQNPNQVPSSGSSFNNALAGIKPGSLSGNTGTFKNLNASASKNVDTGPFAAYNKMVAPTITPQKTLPDALMAFFGNAMGSKKNTMPMYSYDPATQTYKDTGGTSLGSERFGGKMGLLGSGESDAFSYSYNPATGNYTNISSPAAEGPSIFPSEYNMGGEGFGAANGGLMATLASGGMAEYNLGGYSDGGRLLRGPGDGVSDSIPATIGHRQPARLADGEFVVPARIVSELGNGSTEAGARKLYAMMDRVQKARGKTVGKGRVATNSRADKHLPA